jgi:membrane associated rhomboid family serine protease
MGIYDRDYYRREGNSFLGSISERGIVCKWLIGINIAAFVVQMMLRPQDPFTRAFELSSEGVWNGEIYRLLTYAFLHDTHSLMHILFNMLFLWWFGNDVETIYGPREFLAFYLVSAVVGGIAFVLVPIFHLGEGGVCIGASGAVTAVLVLCAFHFPSRIIYLFLFLPVPIWLFVVFSVGMDAFNLLNGSGGQVAVSVHVGGAAFACAYYQLHWRLLSVLSLWPDVKAWRKRRSQPRLRVYREIEDDRPAPVGVTALPPVPPSRPDDEQLEAKMDAVLEKISRFGKENLTDSDREVLRRAAEAIKRRRT